MKRSWVQIPLFQLPRNLLKRGENVNVFDFFVNTARRINGFINKEVGEVIDNKSFLETEIATWKSSPQRIEAMQGFAYYDGYHDILRKKRMAIGKNGELVELTNLPNKKDIDNQYAIAVDKKANYFLGKPLSFEGDNEEYIKLLQDIFDKKMMKKLKNTARKSMNGAIAWVFPYYDEKGEFKLKVFPSFEILPFWKDNEHEELDYAIRLYEVYQYKSKERKLIEKVEIYKPDGVYRYILDAGTLEPDIELGFYQSYANINGVDYNWDKIPLIAFKYNDNEIPIIRRVKPLQDAINELTSLFHNHMLEDNRNTILVIENYDGTDLGEFRQNLAQYGAVKVRSGDGARGGVSTLSIEVNADNYQAILQILKDAIIENARSFNGKMLNSGTPNQMNILSMYQDIDMDTNDFEAEYQSALEELLHFINIHLSLIGKGDFFEENVKVIFNRDMLMNEAEIMNTLTQAGVKISNRTLLSQVPFIDDVNAEMDEISKEQEESMEVYQQAFPQENLSKGVTNGEEE